MPNPRETIKTHPIAFVVVIAVLLSTSWPVFDLLFHKPEIHEGVVVKMEYFPGKMQSGQYRLGSKSRPQITSANSRDRWIATVRMKNGELVEVDCKLHHFENKKEGDLLRFKEFPGGSLEIKYFAHSEEEQ
jgi:hypothetical protein